MHLVLKRYLGAAALALALAGNCAAGTFSVTPVRIYMNTKDRAVAVTITNDGDEPVALQAELFSWNQKPDGADDLQLTDDLILSPPIIRLAPNAKQVVRLARAKPVPIDRQLTYRMVMRQVPEAVQRQENIQVPIALALSMPVFITPPAARAKMACQGERVEGDLLRVRCTNSGNAYTQVRQMVLRQGDRIFGRFEGGEYILPGAKKTLTIKTESALPPRLELVVTYDDGRSEVFSVTIG
jgi:fimbrial chaperone protein